MSEDDGTGQIFSGGSKRTILMRDADINTRLSSKKDWYTYLGQHLQYYLPPYNMVTKDHLKQVSSHHHFSPP